jgi:ABC-type multidrug transport system fused ATPase/permease subunit
LQKRWSIWTLCLTFVALAGLVLSIVPLILAPQHTWVVYDIAPWFCVTAMTVVDIPTQAHRLLLLQYFCMLLAAAGIYAADFLHHSLHAIEPFRASRTVFSAVGILIIAGGMPLRDPSWDASDIGNARQPPSYHVRSPEDNLTLFQFWSMSWVHPLARVCQKREMVVEDVWQLPFEFQHTRLYLAFRELKGRLIPRLLEANGLDLCISAGLAVVEKVAEVSNIRLTSKLYNALDKAHGRANEAVFWCLVMLCMDVLRQIAKTTSGWYSRKAYERSRGETFIGLFSKLLTRAVPGSDMTEKGPAEEDDVLADTDRPSRGWSRLFGRCWPRKKTPKMGPDGTPLLRDKQSQGQPASNAKVVNLVRGDTYEISQRFWDFPKLISQPIKVAFTMYYLIDIMGWPSCVGIGLMVIFLSINSALVRKLIRLERARTAHSDKRAQAVAHFVEASRPLKLNGWTSSWSERIMKFRDMEMLKRLHISYVTAAIGTVNVIGGASYPLASICLYTLVLGQGLPNEVIWPSLQLFGHLESSVKEAFDLISAYWKATIPVERVNKYMDEPDRDDEASWDRNSRDITFKNASFSWPSTSKLVLEDLNLTFTKGLTVIRGHVGAGKSSLLLAALNEMEIHEGDLKRPNEPIAYAQQLPWLQNKTIRENIIFHQHFDSTRYRQVLHACALTQDLASFREGDQTKLEEGGVGLSGGQKARVALARALYSPCRILLLDDPLAALDHDTASTIVQRFLGGPLGKDRIIVMVTHRDDLVLRIADQVIDLVDGKAQVLTPEQVKRELDHPYHETSAHSVASSETAHDEPEAHAEHEQAMAGSKDAPEEAAETGGVSLSLYTKYMQAGGWSLWISLAVFYGLSRYCDISRARLLEAWGNETAETPTGSGFWGLPSPARNPSAWLYVLGGLSAGQVATYAVAQILLAHICVNAAQRLFKIAVDRVSRATFRYHDITPTGQLKNRLISDMGMVDGGILTPLEAFVYNLIALVLSLLAIMSHQPMLLIFLAVAALLFVYFFRLYVPVSRCLRRMEMRFLTPIIVNIGIMQDGLVTIRALRAEGRFQDRHLDAVDDFQKQDHFFWSMAFWLDFRLSMSSATLRAVLILFMVWYGTAASAIGFVLTQTTIAMMAVQQLCEKFAQLQLDAVSLERVEMLKRIPEEPTGEEEPPEDWPAPGDAVVFQGMSFKYAEGLPEVLSEVSFQIPGGATCAVLGRTGSGKSTIANALLVTQTPAAGLVKIGNVDLSAVNRTALRNRITFVQQDPTLFPGTLRDNIDPAGRFSEEECKNAIHRVLGSHWGLDSQIDAGGKNLSQGQRQLVSIGRAVLRRSGLVILDEATASIDRRTAAKVQRILREELTQSTVITIAHRLEAVEDANWCLRLDQGRVVECGPARGLSNLDTDLDED